MNERDWSAFACPNPACSAYGQRGGTNLRPHGWSSKPRNIRCLRCTLCGKNFSERSRHPAVPHPTAHRENPPDRPPPGRGQRHAAHQSPLRRQPEHRPALRPPGRRPRPTLPRPNGAARPGRAGAGRRGLVLRGEKKTSTVTRATPTTRSGAATGTMSCSTPTAVSSSPWSSDGGPRRRSARRSPTSTSGPMANCRR